MIITILITTTQLDQGYGVFGYSFDSPTDTAEDNGTANDSDFVSDSEQGNGKALSEWTGNGVTLTHNTSENKGVLGSASGSMQVAVPDGNSDYIQTRQRGNVAYVDADYAFTKGKGNKNSRIEDININIAVFKNQIFFSLLRVFIIAFTS